MRAGIARQVAASVDAPTALGPVLGELFRGMESLGGMPRATAGLLERAGLERGSRVVELACGTGGMAVELARRLECRVVAIDGCGAFIEAARELAARRGVGRLCEFRVGDVRERESLPRRRFDAALMMGLDPVELAAPVLRSLTKRGGLYAVDDVFLDAKHPKAERWAGVPTRAEHEAFIGSLGDEVVGRLVPGPAAVRAMNERLYRALAERASVVRRERPRLAGPLREFLSNQRLANRVLGGPLRPAVWVVRRG